MLRHRFERFSEPDRLHVAAHSHHFWPDVTFEAQQRAWLDAAVLVDEKWEGIFGGLMATTQSHIGRVLGLPDPATVSFAPSTHELVVRLVSCLDRPFTMVTTDAEFHSLRRQAARWEEGGVARVVRVPAEPYATFPHRFARTVADVDPDLVYLSHVFYDSGYVVPELAGIVAAVPREETLVVFDGYHAFMAMPVDLGTVCDRAFYLAGGYKYAMAGEGVCFMHCPAGYGPRPLDTGWMAEFGALTSAGDDVGYAVDGTRFLGATFDPSAFYRFNAAQDMLLDEGVDAADIHTHVRRLQATFVDRLDGSPLSADMVIPAWDGHTDRGNFVTFRTTGAARLRDALREHGVITDYRRDRPRFGFGVYHDEGDVDRLLGILKHL